MAKQSKFTTDELKYIIDQFVKKEKHKIMRLSFTNLAQFAETELGIGGISYYHFSRDKEISVLVREYNKTLKSDSLGSLGDSSSFTSLNIKEFVKMYGGSEERLTFYLSQLQEGQKKLYDRSIKTELEKKILEEELKKLKVKKDTYKSKNEELKRQLNELKERYITLTEALGHEEEKQFLSALKYTNVFIKKDYENNGYDEDIKNLEKQKDIEKLINEFSDIFE